MIRASTISWRELWHLGEAFKSDDMQQKLLFRCLPVTPFQESQ